MLPTTGAKQATELSTDDSSSASCYVGIAKCLLLTKDWSEARKNCDKAIVLSPQNYKAHFYLAIAFAHQTDYAQAIDVYKKALEFGKSKKIRGEKLQSIERHIKQSKFLMWKTQMDHAQLQGEEPPDYFLCPISRDLMTDPVTTFNGISYDREHMMTYLQFNRVSTDPIGDERLSEKKLIPNQSLKQAVEAYKSGVSVPSYLTCRLTSEILEEPVMGPTGITYEKQAILDYLEHRKVDPISGKRLTVDKLVPNRGLKDALHAYKEANPWVYKKDMAERGHNLESIKASIEAKKPDFDAYIDPQKQYADAVIEVLPTQLIPNDNKGKVLRVKLITRGVKVFQTIFGLKIRDLYKQLTASKAGAPLQATKA